MSQWHFAPPKWTSQHLQRALYLVLATSMLLGAACEIPPALRRAPGVGAKPNAVPGAVPPQTVVGGASFKSEKASQSEKATQSEVRTALQTETSQALNPGLSTPQQPSSVNDLTSNLASEPETASAVALISTASVNPIAEYATHANSTETELVVPDSQKLKPEAKLVIDGVRPGRGPVKVAIFTKSSDFPNPTSASQTFELPASKATIEIPLPNVGRFAVGVFQDINSDGELNRNRFGVPTEPFAFSNNAIGQRGPPSFDQAAVVQSTESPLVVSIKLP